LRKSDIKEINDLEGEIAGQSGELPARLTFSHSLSAQLPFTMNSADDCSWHKAASLLHPSKSPFSRQVQTRIRDEFVATAEAPTERVVVFDEAQRAWTKEQASRFMRDKRGQVQPSTWRRSATVEATAPTTSLSLVATAMDGGTEQKWRWNLKYISPRS